MGAIVNGLNLHYFRGIRRRRSSRSATTCAASIRLAALMKLPSIFVFTHDSIGLGEDGPTHQPIEQLAGLRAMPRLRVVRPAGRERDRARVALRDQVQRPPDRARAVAPGHPDLEPGRRSRTTRSSAARTCCATRAASPTRPDLILIGTGTEVHICLATADAARARGDRARGSSACRAWRTSRDQDAAYRDRVLPPQCSRAGVGRGSRPSSAGTSGSGLGERRSG